MRNMEHLSLYWLNLQWKEIIKKNIPMSCWILGLLKKTPPRNPYNSFILAFISAHERTSVHKDEVLQSTVVGADNAARLVLAKECYWVNGETIMVEAQISIEQSEAASSAKCQLICLPVIQCEGNAAWVYRHFGWSQRWYHKDLLRRPMLLKAKRYQHLALQKEAFMKWHMTYRWEWALLRTECR